MLRYWTIFLGYIYLFVQAFGDSLASRQRLQLILTSTQMCPKTTTPISWPD